MKDITQFLFIDGQTYQSQTEANRNILNLFSARLYAEGLADRINALAEFNPHIDFRGNSSLYTNLKDKSLTDRLLLAWRFFNTPEPESQHETEFYAFMDWFAKNHPSMFEKYSMNIDIMHKENGGVSVTNNNRITDSEFEALKHTAQQYYYKNKAI
jgi:hypothetical protein